MATLGQAYAEIHADTRPFAKELNKQIKGHLRKLDATMGKEGVSVGTTLGKSISKGLGQETDRSLMSWRQRFVTWAKDVGGAGGTEFRKSFDRMAKGNFILFRVIGRLGQRLGNLFTTVSRVGKEVFKVSGALLQANRAMLSLGFQGIKSLLGFSNDLSRSLSSAQAAGTQLAGALTSLAASATSGAIGLAAMVAAVVLLTSVLAALAAVLVVAAAPFAQLLNFALLLPAALAILLTTIGPLVIALNGLGDALELVFENDPKKLADGLAKLSPVMRELVRDLRTVAPILKGIQASVQRSFFAPIMTVLVPVIRTVGPILARGLGMAAGAMGRFVANAINLLRHPVFIRFMEKLFPAVASMVDTLGPPMIRLMLALAKAAEASLPTVEILVGKLGSFLEQFATWIETTVADGRFQQFLDDAIASAGSIWNLITALIGLFTEMFLQTDEGGRRFLDKITAAINKFTAWLKSPEGKQALEDAVVLALTFAEAFRIALATVRTIVGTLSAANRGARDLLELLGLISGKQATIRVRQGGLQTAIQYSGGGVVPHDQIAMVHKGEPILDPANTADKNRGILADAGMLDLLSQPSVTNVYLGNEKLVEYIDFRVSQANRGNAKSMAYGPRGGR